MPNIPIHLFHVNGQSIADLCEQGFLFSKEWMNRYDMRVWIALRRLFGADLEPVTDHLLIPSEMYEYEWWTSYHIYCCGVHR